MLTHVIPGRVLACFPSLPSFDPPRLMQIKTQFLFGHKDHQLGLELARSRKGVATVPCPTFLPKQTLC